MLIVIRYLTACGG